MFAKGEVGLERLVLMFFFFPNHPEENIGTQFF